MSGSYSDLLDDNGCFTFNSINNLVDAEDTCKNCTCIIQDLAARLIELEEIREDTDKLNQYYWIGSGKEVGSLI